MDPYEPTSDIKEAYRRCNPKVPLQGRALDEWYIDCTKERGVEGFIESIANAIQYAGGDGSLDLGSPFEHVLVSGHIGSGKSTALHKLAALLKKDGFRVVYVKYEGKVSAEEMDVEALLVVGMSELVDQLESDNIKLDSAKLGDVGDWFGKTLVEKAQVKEAEVSIGAEAGVGASALVKLLAEFRGYIKRSISERRTFEAEYRRYLSELAHHLDDLLGSARTAVQDKEEGRSGLVLIIDDPDKIKDAQLQQEVFIAHGELLANLACHTVMTAPIDLVCSEYSDRLRSTFSVTEILPSIQVDTDDGLRKANEIVLERCAPNLFESGVLDLVCHTSGGDVRHIMQLVRMAITHASCAPVTMDDARRATASLSKSFADWLQDTEDKPHYASLARHDLDDQLPPTDAIGCELLFGSALLCYSNRHRRYKVHPAIRELPTFERRLREAKKREGDAATASDPDE